jgi:hypothetical protein
MLMRCLYEASATVWLSRQVMNRVTPSSKDNATEYVSVSVTVRT